MSDLSDLKAECIKCDRCRLAASRTQVVFGVGNPNADLLFIGEGPGAQEDAKGEPFVGRSGKLLDKLVEEELGLTRDEFFIANVVKCRPPENRNPMPDEIEACSSWLESQIKLIDPKVVVTLGNFATQAMLDTKLGITKMRGAIYEKNGKRFIPTFHPAAALRSGGATVAKIRSDLIRAKQVIDELGKTN